MIDDPNAPWDFWAAVGALAGSGAAALAALIAWYQISELRRQQKGWQSLKVCERYDSDPVLNEALKKLRDARDSGALATDPRPLRLEITIVMNYLEGVATGIAQGFYDERVVRDHLEPIIKFHADEVLEKTMIAKLEIDAEDFSRVKALCSRWESVKRPWYNM